MYLVTPPPTANRSHRWLFFYADPRSQGCPYPVTNGVTFEDRALTFDDGTGSQPVLARMARAPNMFKVFSSRADVPTGWEVVDGEAEVWAAWQGQ